MKVVIDTSVFIDYSRAHDGVYPVLLKGAGDQKYNLYVPTVAIMEFWSGQSMGLASKKKLAEKLFSGIARIDLNEVVAKQAGELVRQNIVSGFDAIIEATALQVDAFLATSNEKHFSKVPSLKFFKMQKG